MSIKRIDISMVGIVMRKELNRREMVILCPQRPISESGWPSIETH